MTSCRHPGRALTHQHLASLWTPWALQQHFGRLVSKIYILTSKPTAAPGFALCCSTTLNHILCSLILSPRPLCYQTKGGNVHGKDARAPKSTSKWKPKSGRNSETWEPFPSWWAATLTAGSRYCIVISLFISWEWGRKIQGVPLTWPSRLSSDLRVWPRPPNTLKPDINKV